LCEKERMLRKREKKLREKKGSTQKRKKSCVKKKDSCVIKKESCAEKKQVLLVHRENGAQKHKRKQKVIYRMQDTESDHCKEEGSSQEIIRLLLLSKNEVLPVKYGRKHARYTVGSLEGRKKVRGNYYARSFKLCHRSEVRLRCSDKQILCCVFRFVKIWMMMQSQGNSRKIGST